MQSCQRLGRQANRRQNKTSCRSERDYAHLRLIVTNAVYFKGLWAERFRAEGTKTAPFFTTSGWVDVRLMHKVSHCRYGSFDGVKVLEESYRGGDLSMLVVLPRNEPGAIGELERSLSSEKLQEWTSSLEMQTVNVFLPRFKLETTMPLGGQLASLGMKQVFDPKQADLSGIHSGKERLYLDWILQPAYINVDEEGTEAAAVTAGGFFGGGGIEPKIKVFRADHPFLFFIRDTRNGCILFMGRFAGA